VELLVRALLLLCAFAFGCHARDDFRCTQDPDCNASDGGAIGTCEKSTSHCSYPDVSCSNPPQRYGPESGAQTGLCVSDTNNDLSATPDLAGVDLSGRDLAGDMLALADGAVTADAATTDAATTDAATTDAAATDAATTDAAAPVLPDCTQATAKTFLGDGNDGYNDSPVEFNYPHAVVSDGTFLYVADTSTSCIRRFNLVGATSTSQFAGTCGTPGSKDGVVGTGQLTAPRSLAYIANSLYIADTDANTIRVADHTTGTLSTVAAAIGSYGVVVDSSETTLYVTDNDTNQVLRITKSGSTWLTPVTIAGSGASAPVTNGAALQATFNGPRGIAIDPQSNLYIADYGNNLIRRFDVASTTVSTFAGSGAAAFADGTGTAAKFNMPYALSLDMYGLLFVADSGNSRIRVITPAGQVGTLGGTGAQTSVNGSTACNSTFDLPDGLQVRNGMNGTTVVYIADTSGQRIRTISY
jgi:sugar lactone lactonase YvrE